MTHELTEQRCAKVSVLSVLHFESLTIIWPAFVITREQSSLSGWCLDDAIPSADKFRQRRHIVADVPEVMESNASVDPSENSAGEAALCSRTRSRNTCDL